MIAEIIAVGDELTSGQRLDTNSQWLAQRLGEHGVPALYHSTVGDDLAACRDVFYTAMKRAHIVIATGGLGPTADDLTRQAIAAAAGLELELDNSLLQHIRQMFESRGRRMPEQNQVQAMLPKGSQAIPNPHGTAPGIDLATTIDVHSTRVFALPGVPAEMKEMWYQTVAERIRRMPETPNQVIQHFSLKCFGIGESHCESLLPDLIRRGRSPSVGITVHRGTITLRVMAKGSTPDECRAQMAPTIQTIHECLGDYVFGEESDELPDVTVRLLEKAGARVAVCEWGTSGLITNWFGEIDSLDSDRFAGAITIRDLGSLPNLNVGDDECDPCSEACAVAMAEYARTLFGATFGLAVSKMPSDVKQRYAVAVTSAGQNLSRSYALATHPDIRRDLAAKQAINLLRLQLLGLNE